MKNILIKVSFVFALCAALTTTGCRKDFFDSVPDDIVKVDEIFSNREQSERWLAGIYSTVPDIWDIRYTYLYPLMSDESDASNWINPAINSGAISPGNSTAGFMGYYEKIRLATIFIENIDKNQEITSAANGDGIIRQYKAEARFLRAYNYWLMMKEQGPVPIAPLQSAKPDNNYQIPRSSWDECVNFVLSEIALAKQDLPLLNYSYGSNTIDPTKTGRINKLIALAVESQIKLYHASPLYNGNTELADFKNLDGKQLFNQTYDASRWAQAAEAAKAAIDAAEAAGKSLYQKADSDPFRAAFLSCRDLYWDGVKTEGIWLRPQTSMDLYEAHVAPRSTEGTGWNGLSVVQSLVDDFRMKDGSSIAGNSSYNENTYAAAGNQYYATGTNTMYTNREPRFYAYVTFNGAVNPCVAKASTGSTNNSRVEFFNTGNSGKAGAPRDFPKTGYTIRKNLNPAFSMLSFTSTYRPAMIIRLAELYLNYAEALNEANPSSSDILKYLNKVRTRAGLPALTAGLSQDQLRKEIRLERRIELCFEAGHRYFDVRRWKIADKPGSNQGGEFYGMSMEKGTYLSDPAFHTRTVAYTRAPWQRKFYFMPMGQNEMDRNKQLVQFPGY
ncbi:RagB/SusD family nutrient uptake outer membrane protein [Solitalea sp. MAHUQ-68]|uniref:RagB/SusD family nutrient uptake outer membrane protein n=1 Tax=Solitalea agri TaxID=2953739 RepID=A0A9X2F9E1_9SPHI|nr:RagB/SusD family nutrient uptake outer membrane protein [Solitalea agri]MCO4294736.1 RagB/SusD family nutrient uptake outer membrane protein [Solitalea agri]